ncbi:MAG: NAD(P)-dependent oxidoreductase [Ktedonobacteraceae bacterium]|nr:NAD(P)-dependent oxidoreductase [Ktedonobacteraceae bacterium]
MHVSKIIQGVDLMGEKIGFIGLGNMGHEMANNLLQSGYDLTVYNRTASKAKSLVEKGAQLVQQPAGAATPGGIIVSMVANDQVLEEIVSSQGFLAHLEPGGIHLSMSTVSPLTARELARLHEQHHSSYVAAPVFGRPDAAAARKLWICLAGPPAAKERVQPLLQAMGQGTFDFGTDPGAANIVKLCGNFLMISSMEAMAEALTLAEKSGLDRSTVVDMLTHTIFATPSYQNYGQMIAQKRHMPAGFRQSLGLKDVNLVREVAEHTSTPMPFASVLHDRMLAGIARGRGDMDWSALSLNVLEEAGLELPHSE